MSTEALDAPADCTIACEKGHITVHKLVLCEHSKYLQDILNKYPQAEHPIIILTELNIIDMKILINYMYTGELVITSDSSPSSLLRAAQILKIDSLTNDIQAGDGQAPMDLEGPGGLDADVDEDEDDEEEEEDEEQVEPRGGGRGRAGLGLGLGLGLSLGRAPRAGRGGFDPGDLAVDMHEDEHEDFDSESAGQLQEEDEFDSELAADLADDDDNYDHADLSSSHGPVDLRDDDEVPDDDDEDNDDDDVDADQAEDDNNRHHRRQRHLHNNNNHHHHHHNNINNNSNHNHHHHHHHHDEDDDDSPMAKAAAAASAANIPFSQQLLLQHQFLQFSQQFTSHHLNLKELQDTFSKVSSNCTSIGATVDATAATALVGLASLDNKNNKIRCHLCNIGLSDVKCLYRHVLTRHLPEKWGYKCEFCDREFSRDDHLMRHYTTKHKNMEFNREKIRETRRLNREMAKNFHDQISTT